MEAEEAAKASKQATKQAAKAAKQSTKQLTKQANKAARQATVAPVEESAEIRAAREAVCMFCMDAHRSVAFECGHVCICENCYDHAQHKGCPLCVNACRRGDLLWPDAQQTPPTCANVGCVAVFPELLCTGCKKMTCRACTMSCCCKKKGDRRKLFWS